jgi:hypothetical protein
MNLPEDLYWWCSLVRLSIDPAAEFAQPIMMSLPTRRTLTPGMEAFVSVQEGDNWQPVDTRAHIHSNGMFVVLEDVSLLSGESELLLAAGVPTSARTAATVSIQDGTSNFIDREADLNNPAAVVIRIDFNNPGFTQTDIEDNRPGIIDPGGDH